ncbi:type IX secretion system membrane protein, PorP/SprF family [Ekhidna lutea]|uniref:Type IX secretion system membrane protein, PorP/SprF family n=1 Tax=Ekhidna lutea TaxID=447679 RepID=A0A239EB54_EKHLU|nr:PorP/SprF family type IX secretion system membrane protein [Ekhidna lutea]SNS41152.1 type IX secretion system membrane protein, PorP/SprF family [Ekhidna lutea]
MKKITTILLCLLSALAFGQDAQFSQYYAASLYLNPGFSGIYNDPSIHLNHKRQLQSVDIVNELTQVSFIFPLKPQGKVEQSIGGAGIMAFNEKSGFRGIYERNSVFANYAHNLKFGLLSSYLISIGVQAGYEIRKLNFSNLAWGSQYNAFYGFDDSLPVPVTEFDEMQQNIVVNAGIMYYYNPERNYLLHKYSAFVGVSATNLNRPNTSFTIDTNSPEPMLYKYNGGIEFKINKLFVTPSLLYLYLRQNQQFNAGLNVAYVPNAERYRARGTQLLFGTWYRFRDSFIFMGGVKVSSLTVRVSYDMNSTLFVPERGIDLAQNSMEISIQYSLSKNLDFRKISNPLF